MKVIKNIWFSLVGLALFSACLDDTGNYSYTELTPIEIDSTAVLKTYRVTQLDNLEVDLSAKQGTDASNLAFEWRIFQESSQPNTETGTVINEVVGNDMSLNYKVTIPPGKYTLSFMATDKQNGVSQLLYRPLMIESFAPVGLMVMHGDDRTSDVSILMNERIVPDGNRDEVKHNIFTTTNGEPIPGVPGMVGFVYNTSNVYVFTKGEAGCGYRTRSSDLAMLDPYADMFLEPLDVIDFQGYGSWSYNNILVNDGKVYHAKQNSTVFVQFGLPAFGMDYYAEPFIGTSNRGYYMGVFYDRIGKRFLNINMQGVLCNFKTGSNEVFDMNNVGKDLVYAEEGYNKKWYCVMRDVDTETGYAIYVSDLYKFPNGNNNLTVAKYDVSNVTDLKDANDFATGINSELLYYATDTEVKQCNYVSGGSSTSRYTLPAEYAGYQITMIQILKNEKGYSDFPDGCDGNLLYIGIYNPQTNEGKLLECPIVVTSGEILTEQIVPYDGFKRITDIDYKVK